MPPHPARTGKSYSKSSRSDPAGDRAPAGSDSVGAAGDRVVLGRIVRPHGVRGALLLRSDARLDDVLRPGFPVDLAPRHPDATPLRLVVRRAARHRSGAVLELEGVDDRDAAAQLAGCEVAAARDALPAAGAGEYYACDVIGADVFSAAGDALGTLTEVVWTGANDVWVVRTPGGDELLVAAVAHAVVEVDAAHRRIVVNPAAVTPARDAS